MIYNAPLQEANFRIHLWFTVYADEEASLILGPSLCLQRREAFSQSDLIITSFLYEEGQERFLSLLRL